MSLAAFLDRHRDIVRIRVSRALGSAPRDAGTVMFVARDEEYGTIGGGQLEYMALDSARAMLSEESGHSVMDIPLGPEIGQCCGGRVELSLTLMEENDRRAALDDDARHLGQLPHVYMFGAGHVGRALAHCMELLPVKAVLIDERATELERCSAGVDCRQIVLPDAEVRHAPPGSAYVIMTHDHALDFLIAAEVLARGDAAYVGMIGSATKRAKFESHCRDLDRSLDASPLVCPIGDGYSDDKRPEVIAAFVAAEIIGILTGAGRDPLTMEDEQSATRRV